MITIAERIARQAHANQVEKWGGHPYIVHIERVVALVEGDDAKEVAWLHDVIEDTPITAQALLEAGISPLVVDAVAFLTRGPETYREYIELLRASRNWLAITVKIADLRDHLRAETLDLLPKSVIRRYEKALERLEGMPVPRTRLQAKWTLHAS